MRLFSASEFGIDLNVEISFGWYLANLLDSSGFYVAYRDDGSTPVNIINGFSWIDDLERKDVVRRADYTSYLHQVPLPIVSFDFLSSGAESIELGTNTKRKEYTLSFVIAAENKAQMVNISDFILTMLAESEIPIYNYNDDLKPKIGVVYFENTYVTRLYGVLPETNIAKKFTTSLTCDAYAEFDNTA